MKILINKLLLFQVLKSHSMLAQTEYDRNPKYNNKHFSYIAEEMAIDYLNEENIINFYPKRRDRWNE